MSDSQRHEVEGAGCWKRDDFSSAVVERMRGLRIWYIGSVCCLRPEYALSDDYRRLRLGGTVQTTLPRSRIAYEDHDDWRRVIRLKGLHIQVSWLGIAVKPKACWNLEGSMFLTANKVDLRGLTRVGLQNLPLPGGMDLKSASFIFTIHTPRRVKWSIKLQMQSLYAVFQPLLGRAILLNQGHLSSTPPQLHAATSSNM